jgi:hypothetical protein
MIKFMLLAAGAALAVAAPAMAQDTGTGADDAAVEAAMANNDVMTVRNVTRPELARGLQIFDAGGKPVGLVERLSGNDVILADRGREYAVPITEFFAYNQHGKDYFATRASKAALEAQASTSRKPLAIAD